jgi:hypothetical protein
MKCSSIAAAATEVVVLALKQVEIIGNKTFYIFFRKAL